jgi:sugar lactone lactonase YvrE
MKQRPGLVTLYSNRLFQFGWVLACMSPLAGLSALNYTYPYTLSTFAGVAGTSGSTDGTGAAALFNNPGQIATDSAGNVYVADTGNNTIRKITPQGVVTTLAGTPGTVGTTDGTGADARFNQPNGIAVNAAGMVFVADTDNHTIRQITPDGVVTTIVGHAGMAGGTDGTGTAVYLKFPNGLAIGPLDNNLYIADTGNHRIAQMSSGAVVTTVAGHGGVPGTHNGTGNLALFDFPLGITADALGNFYVLDDSGTAIRKIAPGFVVTTLAGTNATGAADGTGAAAMFYNGYQLAADAGGNIFVADLGNQLIRRVSFGGVSSTIAGSYNTTGTTDDVGSAAMFNSPRGIAVDPNNTVYISDTANNTIRKAVGPFPANDDFANAIALPAFGQSIVLGDNTNATLESGETPVTGAAVGSTLWWKITPTASGQVSLVENYGGILYFYVYTGSSIGTLSPVANNNGSLGISGSMGFQAQAGVTYHLMVDSNYITGGDSLSFNFTAPAVPNDLNSDGMPDVYWTDTTTGDCGVFLMNGTTPVSWTGLGTHTTDWRVAAVADFTGSGQNDILWQNTSTGECGFYIMNGATVTGWVELGTLPTQWRIGGVGHFSGTGSEDILWQNTSTGECGFYIMNGTSVVSWVELGTLPTQWKIAAVADFNNDGKPDILWQNTSTGECGFYIMNGTSIGSWAELGTLPTDWRIAAVGDFNGDGNPDILWQNSSTGVAGFYIMNGTSINSWVGLGQFPLEWQIQP